MEQPITDFDELVRLLRGMRGDLVEASVFLPWDDGGWPVASFAGTLHEVAFKEQSRSPHWRVTWDVGEELSLPERPNVLIWERRFVRAEISFTGDPDEGLADLAEGQVSGQNVFLKIYSEGWILDLTGYF